MTELNCMKFNIFVISLLIFGQVHVEGTKRTLSADLNPSCPSDVCTSEEEDSKITLIHIKADGDNDTLHYIWDLSRQPSVLVALCERNTNVTFEWNNTFKDVSRINFKTKPKYTMSFVLTKVFIFDDVKDQAWIKGVNDTLIETIDTRNLTWEMTRYENSTGQVEVAVNGTNESILGEDGVINLKLKCYGEEDHDTDIPHLLHSINVTQVDMEFIDITSKAGFKQPRIAVEFVLVASESPKNKFSITKRKTIDDEYSPRMFTLVDVVSPDGVNGSQGSYVQFRPVSYTNKSRDPNNDIEVHLNEPISLAHADTYLNASLAKSYYGDDLEQNLIQSFNITFGQTGDGFYSNSNYTTWTFVLGYGYAPPEHVSMIIAILACIGMGIPLLLLIVGGIYMAVKRYRNC